MQVSNLGSQLYPSIQQTTKTYKYDSFEKYKQLKKY